MVLPAPNEFRRAQRERAATPCAVGDAPVLLAVVAAEALGAGKEAGHGVAHARGGAAVYAEPLADLVQGQAVGGGLHLEGQLEDVGGALVAGQGGSPRQAVGSASVPGPERPPEARTHYPVASRSLCGLADLGPDLSSRFVLPPRAKRLECKGACGGRRLGPAAVPAGLQGGARPKGAPGQHALAACALLPGGSWHGARNQIQCPAC